MSLIQIPIEPDFTAVTPAHEALMADANRRIEDFVRRRKDAPIPAFVPSDARMSVAALAAIQRDHLAPQNTFCEWGSGMGVTACLAAQLGFDACGIEIERDLVEASTDLAEEHGLTIDFVHGSFVPEGGDDLAVDSGEFETLSIGLNPGYDDLGLDADDFGVIYAYPWPGEEWAVEQLFEAYAARGALLVTYRGREEVFVHRKG